MVVVYLDFVGEIHDEMQVVHKELSCNGVKLKVAKTEFHSNKNLKHRRIAWKVHHQSHLVLCKFFQRDWIMQLEYVTH